MSRFGVVCLALVVAFSQPLPIRSEKMYLKLHHMPSPGDLLWTQIGWLKVREQLGDGAFGTVFKASLDRGRRNVALKIEKPRTFTKYVDNDDEIPDFTYLTHEYRMMRIFNNTLGFPVVYDGFMVGALKYYSMQLLWTDLESFRIKSGGHFETPFVRAVGVQAVSRLRAMHDRGFLMNDLHLGNFLLARDGLVYISDLSWSTRFMIDGIHISQMPWLPTRDSRSRRDELIILLKLLAKLSRGSDFLNEISIKQICQAEAGWLEPAFRYTHSLDFYEEPDYNILTSLIARKLSE